MMQDILRDTWVFQEIIQEGKKEGLEEGKKEGLEEGKKQDVLQFVEIRFPTLLVQAKQAMELEIPLQRLQVMLGKLYRANTLEEAQAALVVSG